MQLRVAPHVHSDWSYDGCWRLEDLARAFARRGYDAVLLAEHDRTFDAARWEAYRRACARASAAGALLVPGIEYGDADNRVHVPVWGVREFLGRERPTGALLADVRERGGVAVIAHPGRREAWRTLGPEWLALAHGVEVWNRKYDGWAPGEAGLRLAVRAARHAFAGLDFHTARQFFPLAMTGPVPGPPDEAVVVAALRDRRLSATAFGMPATRLARGPALEAVRAGESARRTLARAARRGRAALLR
jgi:hypothetical protein